MEEVIKSTLLEYDKSTFLLDIIKHQSGETYINLQQTINNKEGKQVLKINSSILPDIISILRIYRNLINKPSATDSSLTIGKSYFSEEKQKSVVATYFKGVSIEDLALNFDCTVKIIELILINKEIAIVDQKPPKDYRKFRNRKLR